MVEIIVHFIASPLFPAAEYIYIIPCLRAGSNNAHQSSLIRPALRLTESYLTIGDGSKSFTRFRRSRKQEIKDNLPMMLEAAAPFTKDYQLVLAGAPGMDPAYYSDYINPNVPVKIIFGQTYRLLQHAQAALVTSGTATLESALFRSGKNCPINHAYHVLI